LKVFLKNLLAGLDLPTVGRPMFISERDDVHPNTNQGVLKYHGNEDTE
jgi:hypothetical protein